MKTIEACILYKTTYYGNGSAKWHEKNFDLAIISIPDDFDLKEAAEAPGLSRPIAVEGCHLELVKEGRKFALRSIRTGLGGRVVVLGVELPDHTTWALYTNIRSEEGVNTPIQNLLNYTCRYM